MSHINFNSNEYSPLSPEVKAAMKEAIDDYAEAKLKGFGNDYKIHAQKEESRNTIAGLFNCNAHEVFFTPSNQHSGIEIINWSVHIFGVKLVISSPFENKIKLDYLSLLNNQGMIRLIYVKTSEYGEVDTDDLCALLEENNQPKLVSLSHANFYTGVLLSVKEITYQVKKNKAFFHLDAALTAGRYKVDFDKIKPDFLTFDATLINGPVGAGCLLLNNQIELDNSQYYYIRQAVDNFENISIVHIIGLKTAILKAFGNMNKNRLKLAPLIDYLKNEIEAKLELRTLNSLIRKKVFFNQVSFFVNKSEYGEFVYEKLALNLISVPVLKYPINTGQEKNINFVCLQLSSNCNKKQIDKLITTLQQFKKF